jgi:uncharacterized membrane protein (UPF0127 family)
MRAAPWLALGLLLWGCAKSEEPAGSRPAKAATLDVAPPSPDTTSPVATTTPAAEKARARPSCLVPTPDTPPPKAGPAKQCPRDPTGSPELARGSVEFVDAPGAPKVEVELARTSSERERGLMYRTGMPEDAGMLFSWPEPSIRTFWMRNTCIPLDMLFLSLDGTILGLLEQVPTLNDEPRTVPCPAAHVLELNAGWSRAHGVKAGQRLVIRTP